MSHFTTHSESSGKKKLSNYRTSKTTNEMEPSSYYPLETKQLKFKNVIEDIQIRNNQISNRRETQNIYDEPLLIQSQASDNSQAYANCSSQVVTIPESTTNVSGPSQDIKKGKKYFSYLAISFFVIIVISGFIICVIQTFFSEVVEPRKVHLNAIKISVKNLSEDLKIVHDKLNKISVETVKLRAIDAAVRDITKDLKNSQIDLKNILGQTDQLNQSNRDIHNKLDTIFSFLKEWKNNAGPKK